MTMLATVMNAAAKRAAKTAAATLIGAAALGLAAPAFAQRGSQPVHISVGGDSVVSKSIVLPLDKAAIVELPEAAAIEQVHAELLADGFAEGDLTDYSTPATINWPS